MVNWIESSNLKIPETCVVIWHYDRVLSLQQVLVCLPTLRWRLVGKAVSFIFRRNLHVRQSWLAWNKWCAYLILTSTDEKFGNHYWVASEGRHNYMSCFWLALFSSWIFYYLTYCPGLDEFYVPSKIAWALPSLKETCDLCTYRWEISVSSPHIRTSWRWWR